MVLPVGCCELCISKDKQIWGIENSVFNDQSGKLIPHNILVKSLHKQNIHLGKLQDEITYTQDSWGKTG